MHVCAEMLSKADQAHGAAVGSDTPIVTSVGVGTALTFTAAGAAGAAGDGAEPILDTKDPTKFVQFIGFAETIAFCKENGWCYNSVLPPPPHLAGRTCWRASLDALSHLETAFPRKLDADMCSMITTTL